MKPYASLTTETYSPDDLLVGGFPLSAAKVTLLSGQNLARGTLLGRVAGAIGAAAAVAGNTGNGTVGTVTAGAGLKEGTYRIVFLEPATNLGTFQVEDPDGNIVGTGVVGTAFAGAIGFTIADGSADFVAGDQFTVAVAIGTKYVKSASAATNGSQVPRAVLAEACDASAGDVECEIYEVAGVNENALTFGTGHTAASVREALRTKGIHLIDVQGA